MLHIAKAILICFGIFIILVGFVMLFKPDVARNVLRMAGSTNLINYSEITLRIFPAIAFILYSDFSKSPNAFKIFGWIMLVTSLLLYFIPRKTHHQFSMKSAEFLKPKYFQLISPFAFLFGGLIIYGVV
ncbi:hypothetical protein SAMN03097699_3143 [Flavobacteriaceae bacterium MAR_2010_188]|nr:hypothetical protein SAMN03097699_3143 [Flavobacteriaceae bacterium MAR_2010_188]